MALPNTFTDQQIADQLTRDGSYWYGNNGDNTIYYSFSSDLGAFGTGTEYGLNATQQTWIETALSGFSSIFNLNFVERSEPANTTSSYPVDIIQFVNDTGNGTYAQSWTYSGSTRIAFSNIYFDQTWNSNKSANLSYGSYGYMTMLHEILHSLGLEHPGDYNGSATYQSDAEFRQDTHRYSVMSYFSSYADGSGAVFYDTVASKWVYPRTAMVYDILAMTSGDFNGKFGGYGFNTTTRVGDTTYGYKATAGIDAAYDFAAHGAPVLTLYDAGGIDTLDLSGDTVANQAYVNYNPDGTVKSLGIKTRTDTLIDLREGHYSSTHGMTYNIGIAFGTVIENAIGTKFNDTIHGNAAANMLTGGSAGNDSLYGYAGNDSLYGGSGADYLAGGSGNDYLDGGAGVDRIFGGLGDDTILYDVNDDWAGGNVQGGDGFDTLLFELVWQSVNLLAYGFEQSALHLLDAASQLWSEMYRYFNVAETLTEEKILFDDGTSKIIVYDIDDSQSWSEWHRTYDANGKLVSQSYILDSSGPAAVDDNASVMEDSGVPASGNVLANDLGDGLKVYSVGGRVLNLSGNTVIAGLYGTLTIDALGSYSYKLDDANATVTALLDGQSLKESFNYLAKNSDGSDEGQLVVTINGHTDGAEPGTNVVRGGNGKDKLHGSAKNDRIQGNGNKDTLYGFNGDDRLEGGSGNDKLYGHSGKDIFIAGTGKDALYGDFDGERDIFVFSGTENEGKNTIYGYDAGLDVIDLEGGSVAKYSQKGSGSKSTINLVLDTGTKITIKGGGLTYDSLVFHEDDGLLLV